MFSLKHPNCFILYVFMTQSENKPALSDDRSGPLFLSCYLNVLVIMSCSACWIGFQGNPSLDQFHLTRVVFF